MRLRFPVLPLFAILTTACDSSTEPLRPANMYAHTEFEQATVVASPAAVSPAVLITTADGKPVQGVEVMFAAQTGSSVTADSARTNAEGVATAGTWTMSTTAGIHELVATAAALPGQEIRFRAHALAAAPRHLVVTTPFAAIVVTGSVLSPAPAVQVQDEYGNNARVAGIVVGAAISGGATLINPTAATDAQGIATFNAMAVNGNPGTYSLQFDAPSLTAASLNEAVTVVSSSADLCTAPPLSLQLGGTARFTLGAGAPPCVRFSATTNADQQFMLLFENMPLSGDYDSGVFPLGSGDPEPADTTLQLTVQARPPTMTALRMPSVRTLAPPAPQHDAHSWDFGSGPIREFEPPFPAGGMPDPQLLRDGRMMSLQSAAAAPRIGDTVVVRMEGIQRLGIPTGNQKAIVRFISNELIIAEDVRLATTLVRQGGGFNTPMPDLLLDSIAREYATIARVQGDIAFEGRFNSAIEMETPHRVLAVHSLMGSDGIWGYTYSTGNYFVWDYWVGTNGVTKGFNQSAQRVADNLFMHEIAHMRHVGLLQRNGVTMNNRGNRWLVEGFARHTERYAIAHRLLGTANPSRTANVLLPRNSAFGNTYFRDDVPTFLNGGSSMFGGYQSASFVFDYFMDQVALGGGDPYSAMRDLVINGGRQVTADAAVSRWLPGLSFAELFTRARIALYLDDIGTSGLPAWTQYHQFRLRDSRPAGSNPTPGDPRIAWPRVRPGSVLDIGVDVDNGGAFGVIVDGTQTGAADGVFTFDMPRAMPNASLTVTRIR